MGKVLVVVDMQTEFIKQCGAEAIVKNVVKKIKARRAEGYEVIFTVDKSGGEPDGSISKLCEGQKPYEKHSYGCKELILDLYVKNPDTVEFAGVCTDICVIANVLGTMAFLPFAEIVVDGSCCASEKEGHAAALRVMKACNVKVI